MPLRQVLSFLALALLASPALAFGQGTGIIRGRVTDAATGAPLAAVQVRVDGTAAGAQTGPDGTYTITGAPAGSRVLSTRRLGYAPERIAVAVPDAGSATQDFALNKVATTLNDVVVTALGQTTQPLRSRRYAENAQSDSFLSAKRCGLRGGLYQSLWF